MAVGAFWPIFVLVLVTTITVSQSYNVPCADVDGTVYPTASSVIVNRCKQIKYCAAGKVYASDYHCPGNTICGVHNGAEACVCAEGSQWNAQQGKCIDTVQPTAVTTEKSPKAKIPCSDFDGTVYPTDKSVIVSQCQQIKYCAAGTVYAKDYKCPGNTICGLHNGAEACVCADGSRWDTQQGLCIQTSAQGDNLPTATPKATIDEAPSKFKNISCTDTDGTVIHSHRSVLVNQCQQMKSCRAGKMHSKDHKCPANTICRKHKKRELCLCPEEMHWSHKERKCIKGARNETTPNPHALRIRLVKATAPCTDVKGLVFRTDQSTIINSCHRVKYCSNGKVYTAKYGCPKNSYCGLSGETIGCFCNHGFTWDTDFKNCV